ncbi:hypothetical protein DFP76_101393 [Marinomonas aquiplantarum]|uniref:Uncharacterized protein n=1 Tax=Marinomonas aquiplantarum TaxID=491951 RepID=A0A366D7U4_9GAMM|nr:hypothetical protein DFP76_101393 [Marinomonas aquiplantarum]
MIQLTDYFARIGQRAQPPESTNALRPSYPQPLLPQAYSA